MKIFEKQKSVAQLPTKVKLFPLPEVMLLPQTQLPLNIFEKKYIAMIDEALAGDRLIAMIQPMEETSDKKLHDIGCVGRITSFQEASKGQYHITLLGLCRFKLIEEIVNVDEPDIADDVSFRRAKIDYNDYFDDFTKPSDERQKLIDRKLLIDSIKNMLNQMDLDIDWSDLANTPNEMLVNAISMTSPFQIAEKQALLEAPTAADRAELLIALAKMTTTELPDNFDLIQ
ncbi:MAG: LON peptidase substrate-binding domain-containing protein [OCS116 cluster bacterium]|nr:LON peptidase substrate-binding domain-containing protein [OCS116 cluster bacterium]